MRSAIEEASGEEPRKRPQNQKVIKLKKKLLRIFKLLKGLQRILISKIQWEKQERTNTSIENTSCSEAKPAFVLS